MDSSKTDYKAAGWLLTDQYRRYVRSYETDVLRHFQTLGWFRPSLERDNPYIQERGNHGQNERV
jgi:hypothetical protein